MLNLPGLLLALLLQGEAAPRFAEREVWSLKSPAAASLRVTIGRIETVGDTEVVSVAIGGIPCPPKQGCRTTSIAHAPFDKAVLAASLDNRVAVRSKLERSFERGYRQWKQSGDGFFTAPPHEVGREVIDTVLKNGGRLVEER